ncbi:hypothetical protein DSECCO2_435580 [anaerobic digester metagenome]|nr:hypothetical protein [Methanoculleus sp.]HOI57587.1 hypothetical protein [Methanoculleus sp.]
MQLPRGRFHRLFKSTTIRALIGEMGSTRFTGICTIILGSERATLVLNEGLVVLAEYGGINGQHALDAVLKGEESEAAAELNLLTSEQLQLALEFNRPFAIAEPRMGDQRRTSPAKAAPGRARPPAGSKRTGAAPLPEHRPGPSAEGHRIPMPGVRLVQETATVFPPESDEIDTLVRNMEDMDVEQLVNDFRVNCKDMLRRIHLDHLIQDEDT